VSGRPDPIRDGLAAVHTGIGDAGRAYIAGDHERAIAELQDALILARDLVADLERQADPEPGP
jgi:hypothetical protein